MSVNSQGGSLFLPRNRRDDDIFLVSFPRSGNTWFSFILANIIVEKLNLDMDVNLFNIHGFIPDIHQGTDIPVDMGFFPFKRIIKSHAGFHPDYKNVIYILRDPRSVMLSYYRFTTGLGQFAGDISEFIRDKNLGIDAWAGHIQGWLAGIIPGTRFRIYKYEDFIEKPKESIGELAKLIGARCTEEILHKIIEKSSIDEMQRLETGTGSLSLKKHDREFKLIREGKISGRKDISEGDNAYIKQEAGSLMKEFGYE